MTDLPLATRDAISVWKAGVDAVNGERLVRKFIRESPEWAADDVGPNRNPNGKIAVIGAGKAALAMAAGFVEGLSEAGSASVDRLVGQIHIPRDGTSSSSRGQMLQSHGLRVCEVRPPEINLPTEEAVEETRAARRLVNSLSPGDTLVVLLSGGGSALLAEPRPPLTLQEKLETIDFLVSRGADIEALNQVRGAISDVKLGRLTRDCRAGRILTLAISDILGDPRHLIAGGPTFDSGSGIVSAREVAKHFDPQGKHLPERVRRILFESPEARPAGNRPGHYIVLANNQTAVDAAARHAGELSFRVSSEIVRAKETAGEAGKRLWRLLKEMPRGSCLVSGGEPVMVLPPAEKRGRGGRNQHLVLAALAEAAGPSAIDGDWAILSAGTDGQDGVTPAAGAWLNADVVRRAGIAGLDYRTALENCDSATFLEPCDCQMITGPAETNVCDLRVVVKR